MNSQEKGELGESIVYEITKKVFFDHWCFLNPKDTLGDKKEVCDTIVYFKGILILICVKNYDFKGEYSRYFRKAIEKDVRQLNGAERKILNSKDGIKIEDKEGKVILLKKNAIVSIHRIIVHLGKKVHFYPFNRTTKSERFIHVFDQNSFTNLLSYLDTVSDFEEYLKKREKAFLNKDVLILPNEENSFDQKTREHFFNLESQKNWANKAKIIISGHECDLLVHYIKNLRNFSKEIASEEYNGMFIQLDGTWENFINQEKSLNKKKDDEISYFIDEYIKNDFLQNFHLENLTIAEELLTLTRFERRIFSKHLYELVKINNHIEKENYVVRKMGELNGVGIIYVFFTINTKQSFINNLLPIIVDSYCVYTNYKFEKIIIAASTNYGRQFKFAVSKEIQPFDTEYENFIKEEVKKMNWFQNITETKFSEFEFREPKNKKLSKTEVKKRKTSTIKSLIFKLTRLLKPAYNNK